MVAQLVLAVVSYRLCLRFETSTELIKRRDLSPLAYEGIGGAFWWHQACIGNKILFQIALEFFDAYRNNKEDIVLSCEDSLSVHSTGKFLTTNFSRQSSDI